MRFISPSGCKPSLITHLMRIRLALRLLGCLAFLFSAELSNAAEARIALVIGNSNYPASRLKNPANDATAIAGKLRALGFDVMLRTETTRRDMTRAINDFGGKLVPGHMALFYYAGHGMQVKGKNFLIPVDAEIDNEEMVRTEGIDVDRLLERLKISRMNIVILDACRDNPFEKFRGGSGGLAEIDAPIGTFLAYATSPGKLAADGDGANGLYTTELLKAIDVPGLKIEDVFKQVRINVLKASANKQVPWESSSMTGEFYFRPDAKAAAIDAQVRRGEQERLELQREMEKLRAELTKLIGATLSSTAGVATSPATVAIAAPVSESALTLPPAAGTASAPPNEGASIEIWEKRIAMLKSLSGQLDYAKAVAILFDIKEDNDLTNVVKFQRFVTGSIWASALAMGVNENRKLYWANASRYRAPKFAEETAIEFCVMDDARCELVIVNTEFQERSFLAVADRLKQIDPASARNVYLESITAAVTEQFTPGGAGAMGTNTTGGQHTARVHTPARDGR
jgi:hypothetical protein